MKMKLLSVKRSDAKEITEQQAEDRFYKGYKQLEKTVKTTVPDMYKVIWELWDTIRTKKLELNKKAEILTKRGSGSLVETDYQDYPELDKLRKEIGKLEELAKHFDFMVKNMAAEFFGKYGLRG